MSEVPVQGFGDDFLATAGNAAASSKQLFRIGNHWCFTGFDEASELVNPLTAFWLPNTAQWCLGLANLNSYLVPVVDFLQAIDAPDGPDMPARRVEAPRFHLIFGGGTQRIAVAIDSLPFTIAVPEEQARLALELPGVWGHVIDFSIPWSHASNSLHASANVLAGAAVPEFVHHLSSARMAQWFSGALQHNQNSLQSVQQ